MTNPLTMPVDSEVTMTIEGDLTHLCPVVDEVDRGRVSITWRTRSETFELHALAGYLATWNDSHLCHEQITDRIRHDLSATAGLDLLSVETTWLTAGLEVSCSTSPTHAGATP